MASSSSFNTFTSASTFSRSASTLPGPLQDSKQSTTFDDAQGNQGWQASTPTASAQAAMGRRLSVDIPPSPETPQVRYTYDPTPASPLASPSDLLIPHIAPSGTSEPATRQLDFGYVEYDDDPDYVEPHDGNPDVLPHADHGRADLRPPLHSPASPLGQLSARETKNGRDALHGDDEPPVVTIKLPEEPARRQSAARPPKRPRLPAAKKYTIPAGRRCGRGCRKICEGFKAGLSVGGREFVGQYISSLVMGQGLMVTVRMTLYAIASYDRDVATVYGAVVICVATINIVRIYLKMVKFMEDLAQIGALDRFCGGAFKSTRGRRALALLLPVIGGFSIAYAGVRGYSVFLAADQGVRIAGRTLGAPLRDFFGQMVMKGVLPGVEVEGGRPQAIKMWVSAAFRLGTGLALEYWKNSVGAAIGGSSLGERPFQMPFNSDFVEALIKEMSFEQKVALSSAIGAGAGGFVSHQLSGIIAALGGYALVCTPGQGFAKFAENYRDYTQSWEALQQIWNGEARQHDWARILCGAGADLAYGLIAGESVHDLSIAGWLTYLRGAVKFTMEFRAVQAKSIDALSKARGRLEAAGHRLGKMNRMDDPQEATDALLEYQAAAMAYGAATKEERLINLGQAFADMLQRQIEQGVPLQVVPIQPTGSDGKASAGLPVPSLYDPNEDNKHVFGADGVVEMAPLPGQGSPLSVVPPTMYLAVPQSPDRLRQPQERGIGEPEFKSPVSVGEPSHSSALPELSPMSRVVLPQKILAEYAEEQQIQAQANVAIDRMQQLLTEAQSLSAMAGLEDIDPAQRAAANARFIEVRTEMMQLGLAVAGPRAFLGTRPPVNIGRP